jgi:acyl-CoA reductase-like NAD-dependent aldehyde dehydrogenase
VTSRSKPGSKWCERSDRLLRERADDLAALARLEMGKKLDEGSGEAEFSASIFEFYADQGPTLLADQRIPTFSGGTAIVQRRPVGVLLGVMPWNYPVYQIARFAAPNLVVGNTILLKHAESVPQCALAIAEIMRDAGVPDGVYTNLFATFDQVQTMIEDPRVQGVSVTGSERAGATVAAIAGRALKKCVLKLGGSDPFIVLDGDSRELARTAWEFRTSNMGQACNSNKRMIVLDDHYDEFVAELVALADQPGDIASMSSRAAAENLAAQVADPVDKGATLHAGGMLADAYQRPTTPRPSSPGSVPECAHTPRNSSVPWPWSTASTTRMRRSPWRTPPHTAWEDRSSAPTPPVPKRSPSASTPGWLMSTRPLAKDPTSLSAESNAPASGSNWARWGSTSSSTSKSMSSPKADLHQP